MKKNKCVVFSYVALAFTVTLLILCLKCAKSNEKVAKMCKKGLQTWAKVCYTKYKGSPLHKTMIKQKVKSDNERVMKMKPTIFDIANWFLSKESMPHKKLQKLCYYAQAWSLALEGRDIAENSDFQAWVHGPVNTNLWQLYKRYGYQPITKNEHIPRSLASKDTVDLLERVWATYGHLTGYELEQLTHEERPWQIARASLSPEAPSNTSIDKKIMANYYRSVYSGEGIGE